MARILRSSQKWRKAAEPVSQRIQTISAPGIWVTVGTMKQSFPDGSDCKESACNAGDRGLIPGSGISPGEGNGNPLQCSCLESSMDRGALQATVHGVEKSRTLLSN